MKYNSIAFIILAGGTGSRMGVSKHPKFMNEIAGKPCIEYIIGCCRLISSKIIVVTRKENEELPAFCGLKVAIQEQPCGTGNAVKCALPYVDTDEVIVMCSDTPLITCEQLKKLMPSSSSISLLAMKIPEELAATPYGRVIQATNTIVEYRDATEHEKQSNLGNSGIYKFRTSFLKQNIGKLTNNNSANEYYITDLLRYSDDVDVIVSEDYWDFHGINTIQDLAIAERIMQSKLRQKFMSSGVRLLDPESVYLSYYTDIKGGAILEQNVILKGKVFVGAGAVIKAFSYIEDCYIEDNVKVGPFARISGNSVLHSDSEIGNFVEIKRSNIGKGTKAKHLAYVGDADVGISSNIGAGAITCNYDGIKKHKTIIKNNVMIGANCSLIAPIIIGSRSITGAGSAITMDVPDNNLAITRADQVNKKRNV